MKNIKTPEPNWVRRVAIYINKHTIQRIVLNLLTIKVFDGFLFNKIQEFEEMKKIIICGLAGAVLAGQVYAGPTDGCGLLENYINEISNPNLFWVTTTAEKLTDPMGYTNAQTTCWGRAGTAYCASFQVEASAVVVEACAKFRAAGVADFSTDLDTNWCCTNKDTQAMVTAR